MRALVVKELIGPDGIGVTEMAPPEAAAGDISSTWSRPASRSPTSSSARASISASSEPPYVPGVEVAGRVRHAPAGSRFKPGDRVYAGATGAASPRWRERRSA